MLMPFSGLLGKVACTALGLSSSADEMDEQEQGPAPLRERTIFWNVWCKQHGFPVMATVATKLLSMHPTSCASERNWSAWSQLFHNKRSSLSLERARKFVYVRCNAVQQEELERLEPCMELMGLGDN